eukprot:Gb_00772 [translate_table: standard]
MGNCIGHAAVNENKMVHPFSSEYDINTQARQGRLKQANNGNRYVSNDSELTRSAIPKPLPSSSYRERPVRRMKVVIPAKQLSELLSLQGDSREAALASLLIDKLEADAGSSLSLEQRMCSSWRSSLKCIPETEEIGMH